MIEKSEGLENFQAYWYVIDTGMNIFQNQLETLLSHLIISFGDKIQVMP